MLKIFRVSKQTFVIENFIKIFPKIPLGYAWKLFQEIVLIKFLRIDLNVFINKIIFRN